MHVAYNVCTNTHNNNIYYCAKSSVVIVDNIKTCID